MSVAKEKFETVLRMAREKQSGDIKPAQYRKAIDYAIAERKMQWVPVESRDRHGKVKKTPVRKPRVTKAAKQAAADANALDLLKSIDLK